MTTVQGPEDAQIRRMRGPCAHPGGTGPVAQTARDTQVSGTSPARLLLPGPLGLFPLEVILSVALAHPQPSPPQPTFTVHFPLCWALF